MCGIVGLFLKDDRLTGELGALLAPMLASMSDRGPDSAGFAVYGDAQPGQTKITVHAEAGELRLVQLAEDLSHALEISVPHLIRENHAVLSVPAADTGQVLAWIEEHAPDITVRAAGDRIEIYKDVGLPADVAKRFKLETLTGTHAVGHTRMATESAVTTNGAHPFSTGADQCLVHNGSLSNHNSLRRTLASDGYRFKTENDSEVAAAYLTWRMREGRNLGGALEDGLKDLDGFYTFVVGTENGFGVLRDPIACKPAVMAETDAYVAFGSEYRVLTGLPGIENARVWEPQPAQVYFWERNQ